MPTFGEEKRRDMSRSVLPSTRRKYAREMKRVQHKAVRTRMRGIIAKGDWDDEGDLFLDPQRHKAYQGIKEIVFERRGGDKTAPLERWAEAHAEEFGSTPAERYTKLRSMLPPGIVGWHAMTHMPDEYDLNPHRYNWRGDYERRQEAERIERSKLIQIVKGLVANGGRAAINIEIGRVHKVNHDEDWIDRKNGFYDSVRREWAYRRPPFCSYCTEGYLLGDDIEAFIDALQRNSYQHPEDKGAILGLE